VSDITLDKSNDSRTSQALNILDHCRRSLLPIRFSECVNGLSREVDFSTSRALDTCIAAEDFPRELSPTPPPATVTPNSLPNLTPAPANPVEPNTPINPVQP
jgi:hypothetical protein